MTLVPPRQLPAEDGYRLWLRYSALPEGERLAEYRAALCGVVFDARSPTRRAARDELCSALGELLGAAPLASAEPGPAGGLRVGSADDAYIRELGLSGLERLGREGFLLRQVGRDGQRTLVLAANTDLGLLYGSFRLLALLQTEQPLAGLELTSVPRIRYRLLDHWDNLDRSVERGYAGFSLWDWHQLPDVITPRYRDYARANASLGINGAVLNNVNANAHILTAPYLKKVAALADVFRPYGVRVYLSARFSAPIEIGGLASADPLDPTVQAFWHDKAREIYALVPDFGGFLVKANSEGQPGPQDYGRSHAEGANLLARALAQGDGSVIWRAFVYDKDVPDDRAKQAYSEFTPLDAQFAENALLQVKNGPIDFQPREPFHPLFGAMPHTPLVLEVQLTQEYLGLATHLVYLGPLFKEVLDADTHAQGPGSSVAQVISGELDAHARSGMAGVSNIGCERNWCGHPFAQANWYAFGRLAWDPALDPAGLAREWLGMTFSNHPEFLAAALPMMLASREAVVRYMTPLGLHHIMARDHHYGPGPWVDGGRADWTSLYYHRAGADGVGFDRTPSGSGATLQYAPEVGQAFASLERCPRELLLWFHHLSWSFRMPSGKTLWDELCLEYQAGVEEVRAMQRTWAGLEAYVDSARFAHVSALLGVQEREARWWRDACLLYFQTFSRLPLPAGCEPPEHSLAYYQALEYPYVPGRPRPV